MYKEQIAPHNRISPLNGDGTEQIGVCEAHIGLPDLPQRVYCSNNDKKYSGHF